MPGRARDSASAGAFSRWGRDERGFTFVELLVVIIIIGVLAAIALPAFIGQEEKGADASAKSSARNLLSIVEACRVEANGYGDCESPADLGETGLSFGAGPGQVQVTAFAVDTFEIVSRSVSSGGRPPRSFTITRDATGGITRACAPVGGGCPSSERW